jgi:hypothetical protein
MATTTATARQAEIARDTAGTSERQQREVNDKRDGTSVSNRAVRCTASKYFGSKPGVSGRIRIPGAKDMQIMPGSYA